MNVPESQTGIKARPHIKDKSEKAKIYWVIWD
jgi:hypothetical protein